MKNLTFGRAVGSVILVSIIMLLLKLANDYLHLGITRTMAVIIFVVVLIYDLWKGANAPPDQNNSDFFSHM